MGPAWECGIEPGDELIKVDDTWVKGLSSRTISDLLRGPPYTTVWLSIGQGKRRRQANEDEFFPGWGETISD